MFGNINPKQIQGMMKKMGIAQAEIPAERVRIECREKVILIENPSVVRINMQGQESFQISGDVTEEEPETFTNEDIELVIEKTKKPREIVAKVLEKNNGDIAQTIADLSR
jgi:nascent polypeptide-associated complex subunit alpha